MCSPPNIANNSQLLSSGSGIPRTVTRPPVLVTFLSDLLTLIPLHFKLAFPRQCLSETLDYIQQTLICMNNGSYWFWIMGLVAQTHLNSRGLRKAIIDTG